MSNLNETPRADRCHIAIFGRRNAGKSTLMNGITGTKVSVVSQVAGTTTDPVYKTMELLPIGPVVFIDTAGYDDEGDLGELRVSKSLEVLRKTDFGIIVIDGSKTMSSKEEAFIMRLEQRKLPFLIVINEVRGKSKIKLQKQVARYPNVIAGNCSKEEFINQVKQSIIHAIPHEKETSLVEGLIGKGDVAVLVIPIDKAAPKGRLILPQQQVIRDVLDKDGIAIMTKEDELAALIEEMQKKPAIVITDSQVFKAVKEIIPMDIPLTSFSLLFARKKGNLEQLLEGVQTIEKLRDGDKILICEGCTHHRQKDDIGTIKIPKWLTSYTGKRLEFSWSSGPTFPQDLEKYTLIIHCGACMLNEKEMKSRILEAKINQVPITNYGMVIAYINGILERAICPLFLHCDK